MQNPRQREPEPKTHSNNGRDPTCLRTRKLDSDANDLPEQFVHRESPHTKGRLKMESID